MEELNKIINEALPIIHSAGYLESNDDLMLTCSFVVEKVAAGKSREQILQEIKEIFRG